MSQKTSLKVRQMKKTKKQKTKSQPRKKSYPHPSGHHQYCLPFFSHHHQRKKKLKKCHTKKQKNNKCQIIKEMSKNILIKNTNRFKGKTKPNKN
jgi:hypothetical protein